MSFYFTRVRASAVPELPLSSRAQARYEFSSETRSEQGALEVPSYSAAQQLAQRINERRDAARYPESGVRAGELYAAALLQEMLRLLIASYLEEVDRSALTRAYAHLEGALGRRELERTLRRYIALFPPKPVEQGEVTPDVYLAGEQEGTPRRQIAFEGLLRLHLANENPALERFGDLFDASELQSTRYTEMVGELERFFTGEPDFGAPGQKLFELLRAPVNASPTSLEGQLTFLRARWGSLSSLTGALDSVLSELLRVIDTLKEETKPSFGGGPGPAQVLDPAFKRAAGPGAFVPEEYERFSADSSWMPRVVMLAKSTFVWLGQLSKQYGREIGRLDEIPDEELDELARRGFTGIWLIGLWERSKASKTIKNLRGNPDAVASAYSLYDYVIAADLGGAEAFESLKERAWQRGIRMASDMVPNHVGVDSRWVVEHPDWFLSLSEPPYPSYTFNGPDLSQDERVGIFLEDHYYNASDAAVVFKRSDRHTGDARYIYHGNDGTSLPWNDTAQIDYLNSQAREAVIQTILHVARLSPIIRFDAAMTLAKEHVQRLWYPEPGSGGAIASRAQHGSMTTEDFERAIPQEFWREVVDRVAQEVPDTLLLAEAFWMMEGYFVRTLGMHRVYNSAFMHMMRNEDNAEYRLSIKNVLAFEPEILKRFVNFMNNPDEETAVAQFGKDDKYFGVCVVMATMPGLPMFGHGQVEGYTEKYGMEYRRAKLDEQPDRWLIDRHHREVFPLLHRRYQFAEVENFQLYDVHAEGGVDEDVFAYSNLVDGQASLVTFNNKFGRAQGWIREATPQAGKPQRTLLQGLGLRAGERDFVTFRDQISGLAFVRRSRDLQGGLALSLEAYKYQVFVDFDEVTDTDGRYAQLEAELGGGGIYDLEARLEGVGFGELHRAFAEVFNGNVIRALRGERGQAQQQTVQRDLPKQLGHLLAAAAEMQGGSGNLSANLQTIKAHFERRLQGLIALPSVATLFPETEADTRAALEAEMSAKLSDEGSGSLYAALVLSALAETTAQDVPGQEIAALRLEQPLQSGFAEAGLADPERALLLSTLLTRYGARYAEGAEVLLERFGNDPEVQRFVRSVTPSAEADSAEVELRKDAPLTTQEVETSAAAKVSKVAAPTYDRAAYTELTARLLAFSLLEPVAVTSKDSAPVDLASAPEKSELEKSGEAALGARLTIIKALSARDVHAAGRWDALFSPENSVQDSP